MNARMSETVKQGITPYMPAEIYHALPGVSITRLKELKRSGKHYQHRLKHPKFTAALSLGTAAHCATLEPARFETDFAIWSRRSEKTGNLCPQNGQWWDAFKAANANKIIITEDDSDAALLIAGAVRGEPLAMRYLQTGEPEVSLQWAVEVESLIHRRTVTLQCRGRADWLTRIDGVHYVVGLKTAANILPVLFGNAAARLSYHMQWAFYMDGYKAITGVTPEMREIVVESQPPYDVVVYQIPEDIILQGRAEYETLLRQLVDCELRQEWLGVSNGTEQVLSFPTWAFDAQDDIAELGLEN
jgi:hypothetical protein